MSGFVAYHDVSADDHQDRVEDLSTRGYRPITLGVSGDPGAARYAAVWVQRPGPAFQMMHRIEAGEYQRRLDVFTSQGYAPLVVSATGPIANAEFAAIFEQGETRPWFARHGLRWDPDSDPDTLTHENARAFTEGFTPRALAVYGTANDRRFAGIWIKDAAPTPWAWWFADRDTHQLIFEAERKGGVRPAWISVAPDWWQLSVFRDDRVGPGEARHGITSAQYQQEFDTRVAEGMMPVCVQAGGSDTNARYSSIFVTSDAPFRRHFAVTGTAIPQLAGIDAVIEPFMRARAIRAGVLTVVKNTATLVHRGYTCSEELATLTQPDSRFRIASLSKIFTIAAIERLIAMGRLQWNTPVFPLLGVTTTMLPDQTIDPQINAITVAHLVNHTSGIKHVRVTQADGSVRTFEPLDDLRAVAARLGITTTPTRDELIRYVFGEALDFPPGNSPDPNPYSNMGYVVLTSVVEVAAGRPYLDFVQREVLVPHNLFDMWLGATALGGRIPGEVFYEHPASDLSVLQPTATIREPNAYGGRFVLETFDGSGSLVSNAWTVAQFISQHAVWGTGGRNATGRPRRYGLLDGTASAAESLASGIDYCYIFNRRISDADHDELTDALKAYIDSHP
jgi:CubicO group peptidase (beta-lactamase class C family)